MSLPISCLKFNTPFPSDFFFLKNFKIFIRNLQNLLPFFFPIKLFLKQKTYNPLKCLLFSLTNKTHRKNEHLIKKKNFKLPKKSRKKPFIDKDIQIIKIDRPTTFLFIVSLPSPYRSSLLYSFFSFSAFSFNNSLPSLV